MGCCRRNFNTDEFKAWLSTLHEEQPGTEFCIKEDDQKETYNYLKDNLFGQIVVWNNSVVEEINKFFIFIMRWKIVIRLKN